jgi:hypothetical protein
MARSLLGPEGAGMSFAALVARLADVGVAALRAKQFGKQRSEQVESGTDSHVRRETRTADVGVGLNWCLFLRTYS